MIKTVNLDIDYDPILNADYDPWEFAYIEPQGGKRMNFDFSDLPPSAPASYVYENTKIFRIWWKSDQLDFKEIGRRLGMEVTAISSIKQQPGCVMPLHKDLFIMTRARFPDRKDTLVRANIFMEDWKTGHFIQYHDTVVTHWKKGEGIMWDSTVPHLGANAGLEDKFTFQVSGFLLTSS